MSTTALQAPSRRAQRLGHSFSPRLFLSELLLKQWFEPVIPFTVMVARSYARDVWHALLTAAAQYGVDIGVATPYR